MSEETKKTQPGDWSHLLIGLGAAIAIAFLSLTHFYQDQESSSYDFRFLMRNEWFGQPLQLPSVATIDIDDAATQAHGFPFTRDLHADLVDVIHHFGAKIIGFDIFFYEDAEQILSPADLQKFDGETVKKSDLVALVQDHDARFVETARKTNIVYSAQTFEIAEGKSLAFVKENLRDRSEKKNAALAALSKFSRPVPESIAEQFYLATDIDVPLLGYIESSRGVGFALPKPDHDGIVRRYRLALYYDGRVYFSLGLAMACEYLDVPFDSVRFEEHAIVLPNATPPGGGQGNLRIPTLGNYEMLVNWAGPFKQTYRHFPYNLVIEFAEFEPQIRALNFGKRIYHESPDIFQDEEAYIKAAVTAGLDDLSPDLLLQYRSTVGDCAAIEEMLQENSDLTPEAFLSMVGVPKEEIPAVLEFFAPTFSEIKTNLKIAKILAEDSNASLSQVADLLGAAHRITDIDHSVSVLRHIARNGGITDEHRPLFFLDRVKTEGLHAESSDARILTKEEFDGAVFFYGLTATGSHDLNPTPFGAREAMLGAHVNVYNTILTRNFLTRFETWQNAAIMVVLGILIGFLVPRFKAVSGALVVFVLLAVYVVTAFVCFISLGLWIDILGPVATLTVGYLSITLYNYVQKEKEKDFVQGAFGHYLDPKVVDQLVENPNLVTQLGGDQRVMTVFFSDIASFSTISENITAVELVELLNEYLTEMCDIVALHEGTIDKFEGDAIMAFWGAPMVVPDHAQAAMFACIDMQQKIEELRATFERENRLTELRQLWQDQGRGEFLRVRMGVNTGEMVVGNLGSHSRVDYTVMGDAVNLASRLEGAGKAYGITTMISEETLRAAGDVCEVRPLDSIRVVGKDEPVRVFEVLGRKGEVSRTKLDVVDAYVEGYKMYSELKWDEAITHFEAGLKLDPEDGPCNVFIERCRDLKVTPPLEGWDAVHNLDSK
jgi:class 3 adenylate cyclase/CHASE2 domain-containing sensor protein